MHRMILIFGAMMLLNSLKAASQAGFGTNQDSVKRSISLRILPRNFYTSVLPYTCKKEIQLQKVTRLPVYFRLGSKEYVDFLEGKRMDGPGCNFPYQPLHLRLNKN